MERRRGAKNKVISLLFALIFPAGYLLSQVIVSVVMVFCVTMVTFAGGGGLDMAVSGNLTLIATAVSGVLTAVAAVLTIKLSRKSVKTELRVRNPGAVTLLLALVLGVSMNLASSSLISVIPFPDWMVDSYNEEVSNALLEGSSPVLMVCVVGILVPIVEEICLRAMPLRALRRAYPAAVAAIIGGAIFALIHGNPLQIIYVLPVGVILCFVYIWTESVIATIALHIGYNGLSAIMSVLPSGDIDASAALSEDMIGLYVGMAIAFTAITAVLLVIMYRRRVVMVPVWNNFPANSSNNSVQ